MTRWQWGALAILGAALVHVLAARALIDEGVAGALLAGGGGWGTIAAAAGFLVFRLACFVATGAVPAVLLWRWLSRPAQRH
jgi:hypothetical protein